MRYPAYCVHVLRAQKTEQNSKETYCLSVHTQSVSWWQLCNTDMVTTLIFSHKISML